MKSKLARDVTTQKQKSVKYDAERCHSPPQVVRMAHTLPRPQMDESRVFYHSANLRDGLPKVLLPLPSDLSRPAAALDDGALFTPPPGRADLRAGSA